MAAPEGSFGLSGIGQIALTVGDMDRAVAFYRDVLGMRFQFQAPNVAFFDCAGIRLMLGQNERPDEQPRGTIVYFRVDDIQQAFATLQQRGAQAERAPHLVARLPDHELWMAFVRDPDQNILGLMSEVGKT